MTSKSPSSMSLKDDAGHFLRGKPEVSNYCPDLVPVVERIVIGFEDLLERSWLLISSHCD